MLTCWYRTSTCMSVSWATTTAPSRDDLLREVLADVGRVDLLLSASYSRSALWRRTAVASLKKHAFCRSQILSAVLALTTYATCKLKRRRRKIRRLVRQCFSKGVHYTKLTLIPTRTVSVQEMDRNCSSGDNVDNANRQICCLCEFLFMKLNGKCWLENGWSIGLFQHRPIHMACSMNLSIKFCCKSNLTISH